LFVSGQLADVRRVYAQNLGRLGRADQFPFCFRRHVHGKEFTDVSSGWPFFLCHGSQPLRGTQSYGPTRLAVLTGNAVHYRNRQKVAIVLTDGVQIERMYTIGYIRPFGTTKGDER
jgi:hypothetical protein